MISIKRRKARTLAALQLAQDRFSQNRPTTPFESATTTTGIVNFMWHAWISFWRHYWLAHVIGGCGPSGNRVPGIGASLTVEEALAEMRILAKRPLKRNGRLVRALNGSHEELTWGDLKVIQDIAISLSANYATLSSVLSAASLHGSSVEHLQIIRNAHVHPSKSNVARIQSIAPFYVVAGTCSRPSEIVYATEMSSGKRAFSHWMDSLSDFILMA